MLFFGGGRYREQLKLLVTKGTKVSVFNFYYTRITVTPLAACAPITRAWAMSAVLEGPLMKVP